MEAIQNNKTAAPATYAPAAYVMSTPFYDSKAMWLAAKPFATGSIAGCFATICIQPMVNPKPALGARPPWA